MDKQKEENKKNISEQIIAAAKRGELKMRPKWHFVLRAGLWLAGMAVAVLGLLYFFSLLLFVARETGIWMAPVFGWKGIFIFLASLPWMIVLSVLAFILILEILVRRYAFAYRLPLLYSALAILMMVIVGGLLLSRTPLHETLSHCPPGNERRFPDSGSLPCGTGIYRDLGPRRFDNVHYGTIDGFGDNRGNFVLVNRQQEKIVVIVNEKTRLPFGAQFEIGDAVVVIGDRYGNRVEAFGISEVAR